MHYVCRTIACVTRYEYDLKDTAFERWSQLNWQFDDFMMPSHENLQTIESSQFTEIASLSIIYSSEQARNQDFYKGGADEI